MVEMQTHFAMQIGWTQNIIILEAGLTIVESGICGPLNNLAGQSPS